MPETSARLPAQTKVERPSPRRETFSRIATPRAPDWQKKPARPRGGITGDERGVEGVVGGGVDDAEAVGADQPHPVGAGQPDQPALPLAALLAGLGEAGGDHDQAVHALGGAVEHDVGHGLGGHGDDGEVDGVGDVADTVAYAGEPGDRRRRRGSRRTPGPGSPPSTRLRTRVWPIVSWRRDGADHRDAAGVEEALDRAPPRRGARGPASRRRRCRWRRWRTPGASRRPRSRRSTS